MNAVPKPSDAPPKKFQFVGGELCFDFCNSVGGKRGVRPREYLNSYRDFLAWCEQAGLIDESRSQPCVRKAARQRGEAAEILTRAIRLREAVYRIFVAVGANKKPAERDIASLNAELCCSLNRLRITPSKKGFSWRWS